MNERCLFRGKRLDNKEWVEGYLCYIAVYADRKPFVSAGTIKYVPAIQCKKSENYYESEAVDPSTIGQCIGLKDKNGKLIFEGDIAKSHWVGKNTAVRWVGTSCGFEPFSDSEENCGHCGGGIDPGSAEIIGNIHDNPELLEGGTNA